MKVFIVARHFEVDELAFNRLVFGGDFGPVKSLRIIKDRETKESKGFGFVEMVNDNEAKEAIRCMNGQSYYGRRITVNVAEDSDTAVVVKVVSGIIKTSGDLFFFY